MEWTPERQEPLDCRRPLLWPVVDCDERPPTPASPIVIPYGHGDEMDGKAMYDDSDSNERDAPEPRPEFRPQDVVTFQLIAFQHSDEPTPKSGIARAFIFASPGARAATGPLRRFIPLLLSPLYRPLLNHESAEMGPLTTQDGTARQLVKVFSPDESVSVYLFILSLQEDGPNAGCWMTDSVVKI